MAEAGFPWQCGAVPSMTLRGLNCEGVGLSACLSIYLSVCLSSAYLFVHTACLPVCLPGSNVRRIAHSESRTLTTFSPSMNLQFCACLSPGLHRGIMPCVANTHCRIGSGRNTEPIDCFLCSGTMCNQ